MATKMKQPIADPALEIVASQIETRDIETLTAHPKNARKHPTGQIDQIVASIREFGFTAPVLIDERDVILAGHGRVTALGRLGARIVPVIVANGWSPERKRAYLIADNKIAQGATWDEGLLKVELDDLRSMGLNLGAVGFSASEIGAFFGEPAEASPRAKKKSATATIKVKCPIKKTRAVTSAIRKAVQGIEGVEVE